MAIISAGLLLYRLNGAGIDVLLAHPGGPFWAKKDAGAWTIPKGLVSPGEELLAAAKREFFEETSFEAIGPFTPLTAIRQKSSKLIHAWAVEQEIDVTKLTSNSFTMEWPPRSGKNVSFPEIDRAAYFDLTTARGKINSAQSAWLDELERIA